ncbi:MAG: gamma-glutamyl-gamma-aminobutyrate hydrolase family protein [Clostridia bacterium]|nr:gamma-glutamyl-gamma-aminobutyrate hydrolase family protein [Clostridia bacterium]
MSKNVLLSVSKKGENYVNALRKIGVNSTVYTGSENCFSYDVLLLGGGEDVHPKYFGEEINGTETINERRDIIEFNLIRQFLYQNKPILAICRGFQVLNLYLGGTLYQHLKNTNKHRQTNGVDIMHAVKTIKNSVYRKLYGKEFIVNSYHHQALKKLAKNLKASCYSYDGVIEGYESKKLKILGAQFHPERLHGKSQIDGTKIFKYFFNNFK